jgi:hypothetical protein
MKYALYSARLRDRTSEMLILVPPHIYSALKCEKRTNIPGLLWKAAGVPKPL